ncbi:Urease accessory protein UreE [Roseospira navarrensis]|uniref:urease accessory protein UreE n=1 Tax=Roseospira navarrensis TaxID=140058 RepID=UPI0031B5D4A8
MSAAPDRRAVRHHPAGTWPEARTGGTVTLACAERHRRRVRLIDDAGTPFLLDLPAAVAMRDGDGLDLGDGGFIRVVARAEPVLDIACSDTRHAARMAWHLGNRHLPVEVLTDGLTLRIADDHVIADMARGLGGILTRHEAPFSPEGGAYGGGHGHGHGHSHGHGHHHD